MSFFAKLAVLISANTTEFKAGLDDANKSAKKFEAEQKRAMRESAKAAKELEAALRTTAQVAAAAALAIGGALRWADEIADTASAFDITVKSLMGMRDALTLAGGKGENFGTMLQKLANNAEAAKEGSDKAREAFDKLGISGKEVEESAPDELFVRVAESLSKLENPTKRAALAYDSLGKAAKGVNWKEFFEIYSSGKSTTEGVAEAVEEGAKAWDNLGKAGRFALEGILTLIRPLTAFINWMAEKIEKAKLQPLPGSSFDAEFGGAFGMDIPSVQAPVRTPPAAAAASGKKGDGYTTASDRDKAFAVATQQVREQTEEIMKQVSAMIKREEIQSRLLSMTANERELAQAIYKIEEDRDKLIANAEKEIAIEQQKKEVNQERIKALQDQIEVIRFGKQTEIDAITSIIQKRQEEQQSFTVGWERAFKQYAEDSQNYARLGQQAFDSVVSNMDKALTNFVQTGKLNFKELAQSIIQDLIRIQLRMQMMQMFSYGKGFLGDVFGGAGTAIMSFFSGGATAADGGYIDSPTLVGENGPEIFIPQRSGTVIPNQQLSSVMGGQPQVVYNGPYIENMSAIDTQSAAQFLSKNKQAVWAANQSASRSLPQSR